jgi:hypothetical protein
MTDSDLAATELSAGLGDYASFRARMLAMLPRVVIVPGDGSSPSRPLAPLDVSAPSDPTVALVSAYAALADVVSFYQDRILNEGFLSHAVEYASLALLGRSLGEGPAVYVSATTRLALFAQASTTVTVPLGSAIQANPPTVTPGAGTMTGSRSGMPAATAPAAGPVFETAAAVTANAALNQLPLLQTRPVHLSPTTTSLLLAGIGLGLSVGDFMILVQQEKSKVQWVRLTVFSVTENSVLATTTVGIGSSLQYQWEMAGATGTVPLTTAEGTLYALDLTCRLFGYNAPSWSSQSYSVQLANTPPSQVPSEYSEWPGFAIDMAKLDLQAVYPRVLPGSQFLLETPVVNTLGLIATVSRQNLSEFGMSGQATEVTLQANPATQPSGTSLVPARTGHTTSLLADGRVLLAGGVCSDGVLNSVEIFDPSTQLLSVATPLPSARAFHTATTIEGVIYLVGGVTDGWRLATDLLRLDPDTLSFGSVPDVVLTVPRIAHATTLLPDGTLLVSGGLTSSTNNGAATLADLLATLTATTSVTAFAPASDSFAWTADLQHARAGHSATLCPVVKTKAQGGSAATPPVGQIVVFLGGHDGGAMPPGVTLTPPVTPGTVWNDAEVTNATTWQPVTGLYPIQTSTTPVVQGSARYDHAATPLPNTGGFLVTGGQSQSGPVADNWLVGATALYASGQSGGTPVGGTPVFVQAPPLQTARSNHAAAILAGNVVGVAGGQSDAKILESVEQFAMGPGASIVFDGGTLLAKSTPGADLPQPQTDAATQVLTTGRWLLTGGLGSLPDGYLSAVVVYDRTIGTVVTVAGPAFSQPATLAPVGTLALADGTILVLGCTQPAPFPYSSASLASFAWTFDPATGLSTATGAPVTPRFGASLTLLSNGTVLLAGGLGIGKTGYATLNSAEIYDPRNRAFRALFNSMTAARCGHSATLLPDGSVLLAGGFFFPPITYDPPGVLEAWAPSLASAETFSATTQAFVAVAAPLPQGVAMHAATTLPGGDVLLTGGFTSFDIRTDFTTIAVAPVAQAVVFNATAMSFAQIAPMARARAMHTATLTASGKVLVAGGVIDQAMQATASTEIYDPDSLSFSPAPNLAQPRYSHGAALVPTGVLLIGGASTPSYEIVPTTGAGGETAEPLPFAMPSPPFPLLAAVTQHVVPVAISGHGVYAFGEQVDAQGQSGGTTAILFVEAPVPLSDGARRQALVYTQSRPLALAPPIDVQPLTGRTLKLSGLVDGIMPDQTLVIAGNPPLARTIGKVQRVGSTATLESGSIVMVLAPVPPVNAPGQRWWQVEVPDIGTLTVATGAFPDGSAAALEFLSGNGSTIGNVTAAQLKLFTRPLLSEAVIVQSVTQSATRGTTTLPLAGDLRFLYDRTTSTLYGNVVTVTEGATVATEVLGSGDGQLAFQSFTLKQAPLTWLENADGTITPALTVYVSDIAWTRVDSLAESGPDAREYQLILDAQGRAQIQFGDGQHGMRPPTGEANITATYRVGSGFAGNVAAGTLTRAPANVGGIASVLNPLAATGGVGAPPRSQLRRQIPNGVRDLGRIVTQADMLSFVTNRPEVGAATLSTSSPSNTASWQDVYSLITLAGVGNAVPDMASPAFVSLQAAFQGALADPLCYLLLAYRPTPFKLQGSFTAKPSADLSQVQDAINDAVRSAYDPALMQFGQTVRGIDIRRIVRAVPGVGAVRITALWVPTRSDPMSNDILAPNQATLAPLAGAEILSISADSDAVAVYAEVPT